MKKLLKKIWKNIRNFGSHPVARATDALKQAVMAHCRAVSDVKYHQMMFDFFNQQALMLSPHEHWWEFAAAKDAAKHHAEQLEGERRIEEQTKAKLDACRERLRLVRQGEEDG